MFFKRKTQTVDGIIGSLGTMVSQLQAHSEAQIAKIDEIEAQIDELETEADAAAEEAMRAALISGNISRLLEPSEDSMVNAIDD